MLKDCGSPSSNYYQLQAPFEQLIFALFPNAQLFSSKTFLLKYFPLLVGSIFQVHLRSKNFEFKERKGIIVMEIVSEENFQKQQGV